MSKIKRVSAGNYVAAATEVNRAIDQINKMFGEQSSTVVVDKDSLLKLGLDTKAVGPKVVFTKSNYGNEVDVIIPGVLELTRGENQGIYNAAVEDSYDRETGPYLSPTNTVWNSKYTDAGNHGWRPLTNLEDRTYDVWRNAVNLYPNYNIGEELVVRETTTNTYILIKFLSWTSQSLGGGFSYERYVLESPVQVTREDNDDTFIDVIEAGKTEFRRNSNGGGLYNFALEGENDGNNSSENNPQGWGYQSPRGVEWNSQYTDSNLSGFSDLTNVKGRKYNTLYEACNLEIGSNIVGLELIMHDLSTDKYHKFLVDSWTSGGNGGGFSYTRQVIPLDEAIIFADGTSIKSLNDIQGAGGGGGQTFDQSLNTTDNVTFNYVETNTVNAQTFIATSNGFGNNYQIGDDCYIGDTNLANGFVVKGIQNLSQGFIKLGNNPNAPVIGNKGSQRFNISKINSTEVIPEYADNAAAISAGLVVGDVYRTGDLLKIRH